jgi:peptidoglycan/LPS O-acetylase OafA/YrhL
MIGSYIFNYKTDYWKLLSCLTFLNNFVETMPFHYWSVAVEFQMYLISPFIIRHLYKSKRPWILVALLSLIATVLGYIVLFLMLQRSEGTNIELNMLYEHKFYTKTWIRISPYLYGMLTAYYHRIDKNRDLLT